MMKLSPDMLPLALFLALLPSRVTLIDEHTTITPNDWRLVRVVVKQQPVTIDANFRVQSRGMARLAILSIGDVRDFREGQARAALAATAYGDSGSLTFPLHRPGEYAIVVDADRNQQPVDIAVRIDEAFELEPVVRYLTPRRRLTVILISFAGFFAVVGYGGWRVIRLFRS